MWSEEQWQFIGFCSYCGASCYSNGEEFRSTSNLPGCLCWVKGYGPPESAFIAVDEEET